MLAILVSIVLMTVDHRYRHMEHTRSLLATMVYPLQFIVNLPTAVGHWVVSNLDSQQTLLQKNRQLVRQNLEFQTQLLVLQALEAENTRLRKLLGSSIRIDKEVVIAELIAVDLEASKRQVVINKGSHHSVYLNQPVLDAHGVFGKVIHVSARSSIVMLITNMYHGLPVQVNRNGLRTIALGTGLNSELELIHLPNNADIVAGDSLVSSGLGGVFPRGYPVAVVTNVEHDPGRPFAHVIAAPKAHLERSREVILVKTQHVEEMSTTQDSPARSADSL